MKIKDLPKHIRPREKLIQKGVSALSDAELLAIILRTGTQKKNVNELAQFILYKFPMKKLVDLGYEKLVRIDGINIAKASSLIAAIELVRRGLEKHDKNLPRVDSPEDIVDQLSEYRTKKKEYFVALYLNARDQIVKKEVISIGTANASLVHPRDVFEPAIRVNATAVVICHNHPSGDCTPSKPDIAVTHRLRQAGDIFAIPLLDHIILSKDTYLSMKTEGYFKKL